MIRNSTFSDLLAYAYNETGLRDSDRIQRNLDGDPLLQDEYNEIVSTIQVLDQARPEISDDVIQKILLHS